MFDGFVVTCLTRVTGPTIPVPARRETLISLAPLPREPSIATAEDLKHVTEFAGNECCCSMWRQGAGNVRCEARGYVIADSIHRQ